MDGMASADGKTVTLRGSPEDPVMGTTHLLG